MKKNKKVWEQVRAVAFLFLFVGLLFGLLLFVYPQKKVDKTPAGVIIHRKVEQIRTTKSEVEENLVSRLDGHKVFSSEEENSYPVVVMIDNYLSVQRQAGLSQASFIYETLAEGGATRYLAVFDVNRPIKKIGPVRSARPYFVELTMEYNALYVHAGGSPAALREINQSRLPDLNEISGYGTRYFYRDYSLPAPHNLFTDSQLLQQVLIDRQLTETNYYPWSFVGEEELEQRGDDGQKIYVDFTAGSAYDSVFQYQRSSNNYLHYRLGELARDLNNNQIVAAKNVIIQFVDGEEVLDSKLRIALNLYGQGRGLLFQDGQIKEITWQKDSRGERTIYFYQGKEINLHPGLTWIIILPGERDVSYDE